MAPSGKSGKGTARKKKTFDQHGCDARPTYNIRPPPQAPRALPPPRPPQPLSLPDERNPAPAPNAPPPPTGNPLSTPNLSSSASASPFVVLGGHAGESSFEQWKQACAAMTTPARDPHSPPIQTPFASFSAYTGSPSSPWNMTPSTPASFFIAGVRQKLTAPAHSGPSIYFGNGNTPVERLGRSGPLSFGTVSISGDMFVPLDPPATPLEVIRKYNLSTSRIIPSRIALTVASLVHENETRWRTYDKECAQRLMDWEACDGDTGVAAYPFPPGLVLGPSLIALAQEDARTPIDQQLKCFFDFRLFQNTLEVFYHYFDSHLKFAQDTWKPRQQQSYFASDLLSQTVYSAELLLDSKTRKRVLQHLFGGDILAYSNVYTKPVANALIVSAPGLTCHIPFRRLPATVLWQLFIGVIEAIAVFYIRVGARERVVPQSFLKFVFPLGVRIPWAVLYPNNMEISSGSKVPEATSPVGDEGWRVAFRVKVDDSCVSGFRRPSTGREIDTDPFLYTGIFIFPPRIWGATVIPRDPPIPFPREESGPPAGPSSLSVSTDLTEKPEADQSSQNQSNQAKRERVTRAVELFKLRKRFLPLDADVPLDPMIDFTIRSKRRTIAFRVRPQQEFDRVFGAWHIMDCHSIDQEVKIDFSVWTPPVSTTKMSKAPSRLGYGFRIGCRMLAAQDTPSSIDLKQGAEIWAEQFDPSDPFYLKEQEAAALATFTDPALSRCQDTSEDVDGRKPSTEKPPTEESPKLDEHTVMMAASQVLDNPNTTIAHFKIIRDIMDLYPGHLSSLYQVYRVALYEDYSAITDDQWQIIDGRSEIRYLSTKGRTDFTREFRILLDLKSALFAADLEINWREYSSDEVAIDDPVREERYNLQCAVEQKEKDLDLIVLCELQQEKAREMGAEGLPNEGSTISRMDSPAFGRVECGTLHTAERSHLESAQNTADEGDAFVTETDPFGLEAAIRRNASNYLEEEEWLSEADDVYFSNTAGGFEDTNYGQEPRSHGGEHSDVEEDYFNFDPTRVEYGRFP